MLEKLGSAGRKVERSSPELPKTYLLSITCSKPSKLAHLLYYEMWKICSNHLSLELTINKFGLSRKIFFSYLHHRGKDRELSGKLN